MFEDSLVNASKMSHHAKLVVRNLLKHKSFSLISLAGLATSLAASIVVLTYFFHEISFDKHIPDSERTYRVISRLGQGKLWARTFACYGDALENCPDRTFHLLHPCRQQHRINW